jgi:hypothetical protein
VNDQGDSAKNRPPAQSARRRERLKASICCTVAEKNFRSQQLFGALTILQYFARNKFPDFRGSAIGSDLHKLIKVSEMIARRVANRGLGGGDGFPVG